ncbi:hypothetical protein TNCV_2501501 [Trichonephila clavipes]|nr:hypothetical protein TNCV_2501501 [Trichonephila clavipes]
MILDHRGHLLRHPGGSGWGVVSPSRRPLFTIDPILDVVSPEGLLRRRKTIINSLLSLNEIATIQIYGRKMATATTRLKSVEIIEVGTSLLEGWMIFLYVEFITGIPQAWGTWRPPGPPAV